MERCRCRRLGGVSRRRRLRQRRRELVDDGSADDRGGARPPQRRRRPRPRAARRATTAGGPATTAGSTGSTTRRQHAGPAASTSTPAARQPAPAGVGLIDGVYKGTGGFELDPADCPEDWDPKQGITDTEINLFQSLPTSGPLAGFGLLADGAKVYFDYINANGGIDGRKIVLDVKDDGYAPDKTKTNVDEALGSGKYAALTTDARHAEQPRHLGLDQRRVHAAAAQRHRCRPVG